MNSLSPMNEALTLVTSLPEGFHDLEASKILEVFPSPTLIHLKGDREPALFVSILLHGNEYSGLKSIQRVLLKHLQRLPRSLYLFIGNVQAAQLGQRVLAGQQDFNRCWPGTDIEQNPYTQLMQQVIDRVTQQPLFAAIDVHNNTGTNPHYACMTDVTQDNQYLAAMFNHIGLVFKQPKGVSTMAFDGVCPAVTLECGKPGYEAGIQHAFELIDAMLHLDHFPEKPVAPHDQQLVISMATVNIAPNVTFEFNASSDADVWFDAEFELKNFTELGVHDIFAYTRVEKPLVVYNQEGEEITDQILRQKNGCIYLKKMFMPAMITADKDIVRQDCLCYLLEQYDASKDHP